MSTPACHCSHPQFIFATDDWSDAHCGRCGARGSIQFVADGLTALESQLLRSVEDLLAYAEDVLSNREQLACFKPGVVQAHVKAAHAAIEAATAPTP